MSQKQVPVPVDSSAVGGGAPVEAWLQGGSLFGVGGVLLGYELAYRWGLRNGLRRRAAAQRVAANL